MRRSTEFDATVRQGKRAAQPDVIVHLRREAEQEGGDGPRIGLIVGKTVGSAVERHRVARRLRHVARTVLGELDGRDRVVIRALPGSCNLSSARLEQQLRRGLRRAAEVAGPRR